MVWDTPESLAGRGLSTGRSILGHLRTGPFGGLPAGAYMRMYIRLYGRQDGRLNRQQQCDGQGQGDDETHCNLRLRVKGLLSNHCALNVQSRPSGSFQGSKKPRKEGAPGGWGCRFGVERPQARSRRRQAAERRRCGGAAPVQAAAWWGSRAESGRKPEGSARLAAGARRGGEARAPAPTEWDGHAAHERQPATGPRQTACGLLGAGCR